MSTEPSKTIEQLEKEYKEYIDEHIRNVRKAWGEVKVKCEDVIKEYTNGYPFVTMQIIEFNINTHDQSKYSDEEFDAYRKNFYPVNEMEQKQNAAAFDLAWKHHYMNNPHHWDYWYQQGRENDMLLIYLVEMLCDWQAMNYKFNSTPLEYWNKNKDNIHLGEKQIVIFEKLLHALCD